MATSDARDGYILLSDAPGDARRVQMILAEWGLDEASIKRMLKEPPEAGRRRAERAREDEPSPPAGLRRPLAH